MNLLLWKKCQFLLKICFYGCLNWIWVAFRGYTVAAFTVTYGPYASKTGEILLYFPSRNGPSQFYRILLLLFPSIGLRYPPMLNIDFHFNDFFINYPSAMRPSTATKCCNFILWRLLFINFFYEGERERGWQQLYNFSIKLFSSCWYLLIYQWKVKSESMRRNEVAYFLIPIEFRPN